MAENQSLSTKDIVLPVEVISGIYDQAYSESVIARLSKQRPMLFGNSTQMTFTGIPKAQLVGEGGEKSGQKVEFGQMTVTPHKLQVTVRLNDEVLIADEDHKLQIFDELKTKIAQSLGRALDDIVIHKINPASGSVDPSITKGLCDTTNVVELDGKIEPDFAVETACKMVKEKHYRLNGIALDDGFAFDIATMRDADGRKIYGDLGLGDGITNFLGKNTAVGDTLSNVEDLGEDSGICAIVGDFANGIRWGVQNQINCELIRYGDPDGEGDLKKFNQVAVRAEVIYGVGIVSPEAFAQVKKAAE